MRIYNARISVTNPERSDRARSPTLTFARKVFAVLFQLPRKLGDCGESAHAVNVNICRAPSTTKFHNELRREKLFRVGRWETELVCR